LSADEWQSDQSKKLNFRIEPLENMGQRALVPYLFVLLFSLSYPL
jgi:hypothetical protein